MVAESLVRRPIEVFTLLTPAATPTNVVLFNATSFIAAPHWNNTLTNLSWRLDTVPAEPLTRPATASKFLSDDQLPSGGEVVFQRWLGLCFPRRVVNLFRPFKRCLLIMSAFFLVATEVKVFAIPFFVVKQPLQEQSRVTIQFSDAKTIQEHAVPLVCTLEFSKRFTCRTLPTPFSFYDHPSQRFHREKRRCFIT
jgi:hypothetical protein